MVLVVGESEDLQTPILVSAHPPLKIGKQNYFRKTDIIQFHKKLPKSYLKGVSAKTALNPKSENLRS